MSDKRPGEGQPRGLIGVLESRRARADEREEAAADLAAFDEPEVLEALVRAGMRQDEDSDVLERIGESISEIWFRKRTFDAGIASRLAPAAAKALKDTLRRSLPDVVP
jgi:hypothetical protein